jgi:hypothetical protein
MIFYIAQHWITVEWAQRPSDPLFSITAATRVQSRAGMFVWILCAVLPAGAAALKNLFLNPLKPKLVLMLFKNSVRTSKRTPHFTITKINWLTLFKEIIAVYSENHTNQ